MRGVQDPKALTQGPSHHQRCQPFCFEYEIFNDVVEYLGKHDDDRDIIRIVAQLLNNTDSCYSVRCNTEYMGREM